MGNNHCRYMLTALLFAALARGAGAQNGAPACSLGFVNSVSYLIANTSKAPYSAIAKTSFEQRLSDGNLISAYMRTQAARDSAGRTMSEMPLGCQIDDNGVPQARLMVNVNDLDAKTWTSWQVGGTSDKIALVSKRTDVDRKMLSSDEIAARVKTSTAQRQPGQSQSEDLGMRMIAGVEAHGTRLTRIIPARAEGNELPLTITHETWIAKDLGIVVLAINDDPRRGRTTYEVEELTSSEPDPSWFTPPAGYEIAERPPAITTP
jgi:hypothetical protein